jgi:hypothetical protein
VPDWVGSLQEHKHLLDHDPGRVYGRSLLAGASSRFEQARKALDIREDSWLIWRLVLGQIQAAADEGDSTFQEHLPNLLELLDRHPLARNRGLKMLLERYRACAGVEVHSGLRDFAVAQWGNPWLSQSDTKWSLVSEDARSMVASWLKLVLIQQFFSLLATDGSNDSRRLKFWERYHDSIDDMYFALGNTALNHRGRDFQDIRKKMAGRLLRLHSAGSPDNNAFIMCIGEHVVVEFGLPNNACYRFRRNGLPFDLSGDDIAGNGTALKNQSGARLLHLDRTFETWEQQFEAELASRVRVRPGQSPTGTPAFASSGRSTASSRSGSAGARPQPADGETSQPSRGASPWSRPESFSSRELSRLCDPRQLRVEDLRSKNGNLWVFTDDRDAYVSGQLRAWGFAYKVGKGWWRK